MSAPLAATTTAETVPRYSDGDPFILTVYVLAFLFWTAAAGNDFISSTWKSVRETRRKGKVHVVFVAIPVPYICTYIYFQHANKDYKEMGAALLALAFALLHLTRTFMGLWQLHMFKQWAISSIMSMESLGYEMRLQDNVKVDGDENDRDDDEGDTSDSDADEDDGRIDAEFDERRGHCENRGNARGYNKCNLAFLQWARSIIIFPGERDRIKRMVDDILVNDTLIDNRLSDVRTVCNLRLFSREEDRKVKRAESAFKYWWLCFRYGFANMLRAIPMLFFLTFQKSPRFPHADSGPRLVPKRPESIWLNWATALVAQTGWVLFENAHSDPDPSSEYEEHRNRFAEQILLSAALHTRRIGRTNSNASTTNSDDAVPAEESSNISEILGFQDWRKYPKLCSGQFCKQEFLRRACKTGNGLPYRAPHLAAVEVKGGRRRYGYVNFESELRRAREALPPEIEKRVENFDVEKLEWFTIFVSVKDWSSANSRETSDAVPSTSRKPREDKQELDSENDTPVENLKKQLGFTKNPDLILGHPKLPFLRNISKFKLWGNRNILEISCHVDSWIALCAGEQTSYMVKNVPWMARKLSLETLKCEPSPGNEGDQSSMDKVVDESIEFENCRLLCQMAVVKPEYSHLEKSTTFLGCSMEMLRSSLAKWAEKNGGDDEGCWKPCLFPYDDVHGFDKVWHLDRFNASVDFTSCLRSLRSFSDMSKRFVKMRVLWELQNHLQTHLPEEGIAPNRGEAIALCMLSFPAVSIDAARKPSQDDCFVDLKLEDEALLGIDDYGYVIRASSGPQDLELRVSFKRREDISNVEISISICEMDTGSVTHFDWEVWRNAFYGRLEACRRWKKKQEMPTVSLIRTTQRITSGIRKFVLSNNTIDPQPGARAAMSVWNGWLPHCVSICMYEIATEGFILQAREAQGVSLSIAWDEMAYTSFTIPREVWNRVGYCEASAISLKNATLLAQELLTGSSHGVGISDTVNQRCRGVRSSLKRAEMLLTEGSEGDASLALFLLEDAAIHSRDTDALEMAIRVILGKQQTIGDNKLYKEESLCCRGFMLAQARVGKQQAIQKAVTLLERFYACSNESIGPTGRVTHNISKFLGNEKYVQTVTSMFEEILKASKYDKYVTSRYQLYLLILVCHGGQGTREDAIFVMLRSLVHRCWSNEAEEAALLLISAFSTLRFRMKKHLEHSTWHIQT